MKKNILKNYFNEYVNLVEIIEITIEDDEIIIEGDFDYDEYDPIKGFQFEIKIDSEGNTYFRNCGYSKNCYWTEWQ